MTDWNLTHLLPTHLQPGRWHEHGDCGGVCDCYNRGRRDEKEARHAGEHGPHHVASLLAWLALVLLAWALAMGRG